MGKITILNGKVSSSTDFDLTVGTTDVITLEAGGYVGIGTTNPTANLHIQGASPVQLLIAADNSTGTSAYVTTFDGDSGYWSLGSSDGSNLFHISNAADLATPVFTITDDNYVGIGTAAPATILHLYATGTGIESYARITSVNDNAGLIIDANTAGGATTYNQDARITFRNSNLEKYSIYYDNSLGGLAFNTSVTTETHDLFIASSSGYVGIGTTNPLGFLHIAGGAGGTTLVLQGVGTETGIIMKSSTGANLGYLWGSSGGVGILDDDGNWGLKIVTDSYTSFDINNSEKMRILSSGNVGIGTTNPSNTLTVAHSSGDSLSIYDTGTVSYLQSHTNPLYLDSVSDLRIHAQSAGGDIYIDANDFIKMRNAGVDVLTIDGGKVGIGTTSPSRLLHVSGSTVETSVPLFEGVSDAGATIMHFKRSDNSQNAYFSYGGTN
jgi:hypothetical protein